jgi:3-phosphoshikimate 1-carboxyvinyltransferase
LDTFNIDCTETKSLPTPAAATDSLEIKPAAHVSGRIRPPGSKSITNRAMVVAALAEGQSILRGALDSEDTRVMIESWRRLGIPAAQDAAGAQVQVTGCAGRIPAPSADLFLANSGTSMRFLTAAVALGNGRYRLDGVPRMRERPIGELLDALRTLGADATSELDTACPPLLVRSNGLRGGVVQVAGHQSSQFISALLMVSPYAAQDVVIQVVGELVSEPFVPMTVRVMEDFGVAVESTGAGRFRVPARQRYRGRTYQIEPDATAASYFWAAAAITRGEVTVEGLGGESIQGDVAFVDLLERMGAQVIRRPDSITVVGRPLRGIEADMRAISDTALTLAVVACFAEGPTRISHIAHIRAQETDRIAAMAQELRRIGATVLEQPDGLTIQPGALRGAQIETYNDHRMAMSFALAGLRVPAIVIRNPSCTMKTYPGFFDDLHQLTGKG